MLQIREIIFSTSEHLRTTGFVRMTSTRPLFINCSGAATLLDTFSGDIQMTSKTKYLIKGSDDESQNQPKKY